MPGSEAPISTNPASPGVEPHAGVSASVVTCPPEAESPPIAATPPLGLPPRSVESAFELPPTATTPPLELLPFDAAVELPQANNAKTANRVIPVPILVCMTAP